MLSNEDQESPLAKVASIIVDVFDVVNSEKKDELFDAGNPTETITTRISRTDVWDALSEFAIPHRLFPALRYPLLLHEARGKSWIVKY